MKVRCTDKTRHSGFTIGKIYEMTDSGIVADDGMLFNAFLDKMNGCDTPLDAWRKWSTDTKFEEVKEDMNKEFTKDDLKTGMVVEVRQGNLAVVIGEGIFFNKKWQPLCDYKDDLLINEKYRNNADIMKVFKQSSGVYGINDLLKKGELIYERQEKSPIELEIEKIKAEKAEYDKKFNDRIAELESKL